MPDDRSEAEVSAGFQYDPNTDRVIFDLSNGDKLIRLRRPTGGQPAHYQVARFGNWAFDKPGTPPAWHPIHAGPEEITPDSAIRWAQTTLNVEPSINVLPPEGS